jgi:HlyD family type I secretion membrane fusion protein
MKALAAPSLADLLAGGEPDPNARPELRRQVVRALAPLSVVLTLAVIWATIAPLSGAVVAPGQVKVELNRKTVAHQEGGIVREILVRDGQQVRANDPLVVVGDVRRDAELSLLQDQLRAERIRGARAAAEAALAARFTAPADLADHPGSAEHLARESALFEARRRALDEQLASLQAQMRDAQAQIAALESQLEATDTSARLAAEELEINDKLARQGFVQRTRLLALERTAADYRARQGEYRSDLATARQRVGELQARVAFARNQYRQQGADELKEATARVRELEERLRPSQDQVERMTVRAPVDGEVMALRVSAVGEVVGPREPILDVVPAREKLVVEARVRPEDIDYVRRGGGAEVRLTAFDARAIPLLPGKVLFVSPDRVTGSDGREAWFVTTVEVDLGDIGDRSAIRLQAGMPAEVFVTTSARTLLEYLWQPLNAFANRALREP